jgi:hypothetical protein
MNEKELLAARTLAFGALALLGNAWCIYRVALCSSLSGKFLFAGVGMALAALAGYHAYLTDQQLQRLNRNHA